MKKLLIMICLLAVSEVSFAQKVCDTKETVNEVKEDVNSPTPKALEGATILIKMKDGTVKEMAANEFKVVPRKQQFKVKERIIEKTNCPAEVVREVVRVEEAHKNIISAYVAHGQSGLKKTIKGNETKVETEKDLGFGLQYQRRFDRIYVGGQIDTNSNLGVSLGVGF